MDLKKLMIYSFNSGNKQLFIYFLLKIFILQENALILTNFLQRVTELSKGKAKGKPN